MRLQFFLIFLLACFLSSCANKMTLPGDYDIQIRPEKQTERNIGDIKIIYIVPDNIIDKKTIAGLFLGSKKWGTETKQEKIITSINNNRMIVERREDNGVAGSGLIYSIDVENILKGKNRVVTFIPKKVKPYQQGIILPFPLPTFDLRSYLASASVFHKFEVTSEYSQDAIKANFDRLLGTTNTYLKYNLNSNNFSAELKVKIYPYRTGSKMVVDSTMFDMKILNNVINVSDNIKELEKRVKQIVQN